MTLPITISIIGVVISAISVCAVIYFNSKNSKHTDKKDTEEYNKERIEEIKERTRENAVINAKLDNISASNIQIKEQVSSLVEKVDLHGDRITKAEESLKQVWHEIKELKEDLDKKEDKR